MDEERYWKDKMDAEKDLIMTDCDCVKVGADATIKWKGGVREVVYISFGEYDEDTERDSYGMDDEQIFFYSTPEEVENDDCSDEWSIVEYDFRYEEE